MEENQGPAVCRNQGKREDKIMQLSMDLWTPNERQAGMLDVAGKLERRKDCKTAHHLAMREFIHDTLRNEIYDPGKRQQ